MGLEFMSEIFRATASETRNHPRGAVTQTGNVVEELRPVRRRSRYAFFRG
jgi:hypothetical protein